MKTLSKLNLVKNDEKFILDKSEQKLIFGGYAGNSCCYWENLERSGCTDDPDIAEEKGKTHWACNNWEAREKCRC